MRLAEFLEHDSEAILIEWESFARTLLPAATGMADLALRDHAPQILQAISQDLRTAQSSAEQHAKAQGLSLVEAPPATAAEVHAVLRARSGFSIAQLVAEYRALRGSVLRLWIDAAHYDRYAFEDMLRFNEAIDQAVAESVMHFHREVEASRNLLLSMLGHDMRSPLTTLLMTADVLQMLDAGPQVAAAARRLARSGHSLKALVDDLLDFSRTRLGFGLSVQPVPTQLAAIVTDELEQLRGAYPDRAIELTVSAEEHGEWDGARVQQLLRNLVSNALRYGAAAEPVRVLVQGDATNVFLAVTNKGRNIEPSARTEMFKALKRGSEQGDGMGLGLYIVSAIAEAHGGDVGFSSDGGETVFKVRLPRVAPVH